MEGNFGVIVWVVVMAVIFFARQAKKQRLAQAQQESANNAGTSRRTSAIPSVNQVSPGGRMLGNLKTSLEQLLESAVGEERPIMAVPPPLATEFSYDDAPDEKVVSPPKRTKTPLPGTTRKWDAFTGKDGGDAYGHQKSSSLSEMRREKLMQAVIWSEILDKPVALRSR